MIKIIASDLDGTLLQNGAQALDPQIFDLIMRLKEHGVLFAAASGRQYYNLRRLFEPIKNEISYIAENGSLCICQGKILSEGLIERDLGLRIIDAIHAFPGCDCIVSGQDVCYTDSRSQRFTNHLINILGNNTKIVDNLKTDIAEPFLKISVCDFSGTNKCERYFKDLFSSEIKVVTSGNVWIDFIAPNANKGTALSDLLRHLHIDPKDCIAFGDQYNDIEMLQTAGESYAMSNAAPGVAYYSTYVTDSVADVLQDLLASLEL